MVNEHESNASQEQEAQLDNLEDKEKNEAPKKKIPKGLSRKEQKEKEKRLKREAELIENAKRQEALASKMQQLADQKLKLEREKQAEMEDPPEDDEARSSLDTNNKEKEESDKSVDIKSDKSEKLPVVQQMEKYDFEIQSYHSS